MELPELPPLPVAAIVAGELHERDPAWYDEDQMRAYALEAVRAERERAARIAAGFATCGCNGVHGRCNEDDAPLAIAAAIRAQGSKT